MLLKVVQAIQDIPNSQEVIPLHQVVIQQVLIHLLQDTQDFQIQINHRADTQVTHSLVDTLHSNLVDIPLQVATPHKQLVTPHKVATLPSSLVATLHSSQVATRRLREFLVDTRSSLDNLLMEANQLPEAMLPHLLALFLKLSSAKELYGQSLDSMWRRTVKFCEKP
jgi:hypothetical protein